MGVVINDRYRLDDTIGAGSMGRVYKAFDTRTERAVAVKLISEELLKGKDGEKYKANFMREATVTRRIDNPHVVPIRDFGTIRSPHEWRDGAYLAMEYVPGRDLRTEMVGRRENGYGFFSIRETLDVVHDVLDGLSPLHAAGITHRDIKPGNILHDHNGEYRITDFGLAKRMGETTFLDGVKGTVAYMPPEVIRGGEWREQSDLYSVGIMCWELVGGRQPFLCDDMKVFLVRRLLIEIPPLAQSYPLMPRAFSDFVARLTCLDPAQRPANAAAALDECEGIRRQMRQADLDWRPDVVLKVRPVPLRTHGPGADDDDDDGVDGNHLRNPKWPPSSLDMPDRQVVGVEGTRVMSPDEFPPDPVGPTMVMKPERTRRAWPFPFAKGNPYRS